MSLPLSLRRRRFFDFFPPPEFLTLSTAGIAITDLDTRLIELRRELFGDGFRLVHATKVTNPSGAVSSGVIIDQEAMVSVIKKLDSRHHPRYINATLPEEKAYLFTTTIKQVPASGLRDAVAFIVEENVPITLMESVFDFEVIENIPDSEEIKLTVTVLPKNLIESYINLFEAAGMIPVSFDLESQAIARAVIHEGDRRSVLIANLLEEKTGFYVVEDEVVQFSTTVGYGSKNSNQDLNDIKAEMHKVLAFWNAHTDKFGNSVEKIGKLVLCGVGATDHSFVERLTNGSGVDHIVADVWLNTSASRRRVSEIPFEEGLNSAASIGLIIPHAKHRYA